VEDLLTRIPTERIWTCFRRYGKHC